MTLARAFNRAWDREPDHFTADLIVEMSGRDLDRTIAELTDDEIVALVTPQTTAAAHTPSVVTIHEGQAARSLGRESAR